MVVFLVLYIYKYINDVNDLKKKNSFDCFFLLCDFFMITTLLILINVKHCDIFEWIKFARFALFLLYIPSFWFEVFK